MANQPTQYTPTAETLFLLRLNEETTFPPTSKTTSPQTPETHHTSIKLRPHIGLIHFTDHSSRSLTLAGIQFNLQDIHFTSCKESAFAWLGFSPNHFHFTYIFENNELQTRLTLRAYLDLKGNITKTVAEATRRNESKKLVLRANVFNVGFGPLCRTLGLPKSTSLPSAQLLINFMTTETPKFVSFLSTILSHTQETHAQKQLEEIEAYDKKLQQEQEERMSELAKAHKL